MARPRDPEKKKARLTLEMSQRTRDDLDELRERTGAVSAAEVIREALAVYDLASSKKRGWPQPLSPAELVRRALEVYGFVTSEAKAGKAIIVRGEDGIEERVRLV
jgi:hypothetical protein